MSLQADKHGMIFDDPKADQEDPDDLVVSAVAHGQLVYHDTILDGSIVLYRRA